MQSPEQQADRGQPARQMNLNQEKLPGIRLPIRPAPDPEAVRNLVSAYQLHPKAAELLASRGMELETAADFLAPDLREIPDPLDIKGMAEIVGLIQAAAAADKRIAICPDTDADGLTSAAIIYNALTACGIKCELHADQSEYGFRSSIVDQFSDDVELVLVLDQGTHDSPAIEYAQSQGLAVGVVDHHSVDAEEGVAGGKLNPADAFVNPHQPGCGFAEGSYSTGGLAYQLVRAVHSALPAAQRLNPDDYLDLAAISTIADMVPLIGGNRILAAAGIERAGASINIGLRALLEEAGCSEPITAADVGWKIGPLINASKRVGDVGVVLDLLTTNDAERARRLVEQLREFSVLRRETQRINMSLAQKKMKGIETLPAALVLRDSNFHPGVGGLVANALMREHDRPTAVMCPAPAEPDRFETHIRSPKGVDVSVVVAELVKRGLALKGGGHPQAAGCTVLTEHAAAFEQAFVQLCAEQRASGVRSPATADLDIKLGELTSELIDAMAALEPFGIGNEQPLYRAESIKVTSAELIKDRHLKICLRDSSGSRSAVLWNTTAHPVLRAGAVVDTCFKTRSGRFGVELDIVDAQPAA